MKAILGDATGALMDIFTGVVSLSLVLVMLIPNRLDFALSVRCCATTFTVSTIVPLAVEVMLVVYILCIRRGKVRSEPVLMLGLPWLWVGPLLVGLLVHPDTVFSNLSGVVLALYGYIVPPTLCVWITLASPKNFSIRRVEPFFFLGCNIIAVLALASSYNLTGWLGLDMSTIGSSATGFYRYRTPMGGPITTSFPLQIAALVSLSRALQMSSDKKNEQRRRVFYLLQTAFFSAVVLLGVSRANVGALVVGLLMVLLDVPARWQLKIRAVVSLLVVAVLIGILAMHAAARFGARVLMDRLLTVQDMSTGVRISSGIVALRSILDNPVFGAGLAVLWPRDGSTELRNLDGLLVAREPHSAYLLIGSEGGFLAMAGFILVMLFLAHRIPRSLVGYRSMVLSSMLFFFFSSDIFVTTRVAVIFFMLTGMAIASRSTSRNGRGIEGDHETNLRSYLCE